MKNWRLFALTIVALAVSSSQASISTTKHNLSVSGPGTIKATSETRVCVFCHTPHRSVTQAPLWNRADPGGTYLMYWSPTMDAYPSAAAAPQPSGSSKLCLSCHDGTIALGATVASGTITMTGGITTMPTNSASYLGLDLSGDHPVSFAITESLITTNNAKGDVPLRSLGEIRSHPVVKLDEADRIQCSTCHDPHDDTYTDFLVATDDVICTACHS